MSDARNYDERLLAQEDRAYRDSDARDYTRANRLHRRIGKAIARPVKRITRRVLTALARWSAIGSHDEIERLTVARYNLTRMPQTPVVAMQVDDLSELIEVERANLLRIAVRYGAYTARKV